MKCLNAPLFKTLNPGANKLNRLEISLLVQEEIWLGKEVKILKSLAVN